LKIKYVPIGVIHTPYYELHDMPIQFKAALGVKGTIEICPQYVPALKDIAGFSHIILLYHFHLSKSWKPLVKPFLDNEYRGLFATRAPKRPNPIGFSIVQLNSIKENIMHVENIDIIDGTPLLDIKPYVPDFDHVNVHAIGWLQGLADNVDNQLSDNRFSD